jgi:hypothetical protein
MEKKTNSGDPHQNNEFGRTSISYNLTAKCVSCEDTDGQGCHRIVLDEFTMSAVVRIRTHWWWKKTLKHLKQLPDDEVQDSYDHEMTHLAAAKRWHDQNEPLINHDLNTDCEFPTLSACEAEKESRLIKWWKRWVGFDYGEKQHHGRHWRNSGLDAEATEPDFSLPATPGYRPTPSPFGYDFQN